MIIITNIEFLLLGMPDEITPPSPAEINKKFLIIAAIIILVLGVAAWFIFVPGTTTPPGTETPGPSGSLPASPAGEQIQWQNYDNAKYGYSLKYPQNWIADVSQAEKDFVNKIGGALVLSNYQNPLEQLTSQNPPADLMTMFVTVYQVSSQTTPDQFIKDKKYLTPLSQAPVVFGGLQGKQLLYTFPKSNTEVLNIMTILKQDTKMFVFSYNSFKPDKSKLPQEVVTIHDQILKSFQVK